MSFCQGIIVHSQACQRNNSVFAILIAEFRNIQTVISDRNGIVIAFFFEQCYLLICLDAMNDERDKREQKKKQHQYQ